ncbi:Nn.00g105300.m01.CDS01 [Neocucurbitaria sp. VM-36]
MAPNSKLNAKRKAKRESANVKAAPKKDESPVVAASSIPLELQQLLLNIFRNSFAERLSSDIDPLLQEVKGYLYNRDFASAFGKSEYLEAYAARWSPSRALGYLDLFWDLREYLWSTKSAAEEGTDEQTKTGSNCKVVCLGGGAGAEIVALGGLQRLLTSANSDEEEANYQRLEVVATDIADWNSVVQSLAAHVTTAPPLSKFASAAAKAANTALVDPENINITFLQHDILTAYSTDVSSRLEDARLVTLMFTLNELYSTSVSLTQKFLLDLTATVKPGSLLLVVDSPGSYSSITLNGAEKKYPMQWLLDHTLLKLANDHQRERGKEEELKWEKVQEDQSRWFRLDPELEYSIELENMRMQLHLYRRL